jgi:hypothetical protein
VLPGNPETSWRAIAPHLRRRPEPFLLHLGQGEPPGSSSAIERDGPAARQKKQDDVPKIASARATPGPVLPPKKV